MNIGVGGCEREREGGKEGETMYRGNISRRILMKLLTEVMQNVFEQESDKFRSVSADSHGLLCGLGWEELKVIGRD